MTDPWGIDQPPASTDAPPLPPRLARLAAVQATGQAIVDVDPYAEHFPAPAELAEVQELLARGWQPLPGAPLYCLLPAAWPSPHRTWLPDRLPRVSTGSTTDTYYGAISPGDTDDDPAAQWTAELAAAAGLPAPPTGRIWLLRSPWPRIPVSVICEIVWSLVDSDQPDEIGQVYTQARDVLAWDEDRAWAAIAPETRRLLDAWAAAGREGEAAADLVAHRLGPDTVPAALAETGLTETELLRWLDGLDGEADADAIAFIRAWRAAGLPGDPPAGAVRYRDRDPGELKSWLDAGFDLYAADRLEYAGVATALAWRQAGFTEAETYELLRRDPALTTDEAHAFDGADAVHEHRRDWIYYGFTAAQARAWAAAEVSPEQARRLRAQGYGPGDVDDVPPPAPGTYTALTVSSGEPPRPNRFRHVPARPDPPGTRGRYARRTADDDDPWINDD